MGSGGWTKTDFVNYSTSRGRGITPQGIVTADNLQDYFTQKTIHKDLNPYNVVRECCDSEEHPNTIPVILGLDVTGSMGNACIKTAQTLNTIMTSLYEEISDVEFMVMGIGDLSYDHAPIQASQFESDIRIAEHLDKIYMEHGGGGNGFESYTSAWYFGLYHTMLDCWKRGKKGIIITMGDESLNPYLPHKKLMRILEDNLEGHIETSDLYKLVINKFDIYHISINDKESSYKYHSNFIDNSFKKVLGDNYKVATLDELPKTITDFIKKSCDKSVDDIKQEDNIYNNTVSW